MGAIFISYTGRDPEGDAWADRLADWFTEWGYGYFRDKDHSHGVKAGDEWRQTLYRELDEARAMVCLCSPRYDSSPWCVGEVAIAVKDGKTVIPIQLAKTAEELRSEPLPLLLQSNQAIQVPDAANPSPEVLAKVRRRLRAKLRETLNWRDLQPWDSQLAPYPGLPAFQEEQAPVFFGRDGAIETMVERLTALALGSEAFLLLLGASGYGKSSLVRAGVVPRLKGDGEGRWTVLPPFTPGDEPFQELERAVVSVGGGFDAADPLGSLRELRRQRDTRLLLVIDQFEELLSVGPKDDGQPDQAELFQAFLLNLLRVPKAGLLVLATMRTDFLAPLQTRWPALTAMAKTLPLEPIEPADFGMLITGPADRSKLTLEPGLKERLVEESGGRDALPLLAFTLEKLWLARARRGVAAGGTRPGEQWDLTLEDYRHLGGVAGSVSTRARECWDPKTSGEAERAALREAFLDHLVSVSADGQEAKRPARLEDLPPASLAIVRRLVDDRLLVWKEGTVEIAHEALLRTWEPLVGWIEESKVERLQGLRVKRLAADLTGEAPERARRQALEQLAALAAAGGSEERAVRKEGREALTRLLGDGSCPLADRQDGALVLALIGAEQPLRDGLADTEAPVALRRRAAESLGLLAKRSGDRDQRDRIADELEGWLRGEALDVRIEPVSEPTALAVAREAAQRQVAAQVEQARASGQLGKMKEEQLRQAIRELEEQRAQQELWAMGASPGWAEHDARLPLLQGASRGLQLAVSADLPLFGGGPGRLVPMLTLTALEEGSGLRIRTEVVERPVWTLPLPGGEHLELVVAPGGDYWIGSPPQEAGRSVYSEQSLRQKCKGVDVEPLRKVRLSSYAMVRHPISQAQWRAVVEGVAADQRGALGATPGTFREEDPWERYGQPGALPADSVSWSDCQQWLEALNGWLASQWPAWAEDNPGLGSQAAQLALASESQWETACRAVEASSAQDVPKVSPFHFGATLDSSWARYDANYTYGRGRRGDYEKRPVPIGFFGLVNRWGLAELHGQLLEWCADQWHRSPLPADQGKRRGWWGGGTATQVLLDGRALEGPDPGLAEVPVEQQMRLLRGGSWFYVPHYCRSAFRFSDHPGDHNVAVGFRVCCLPPGSLLGP